jgi:outer membrane receptor protein involved in Fe transport
MQLKPIFKTIAIILLIAISIPDTNAQRRGNQGIPDITITGTIIDGETSLPLPFATVSIFAKRDSALLGGGISDENGKFSVKSKPGLFWVEIEYISYASQIIENIPMESGKTSYDLGQIALISGGVALDEVEITAVKSTTQFALDKRVFNVGTDLGTKGGNAQDILDNVPSVNVDVEGNVTLRGSSGVRILIDGQLSGLVGIGDANGLRNIPADLIDKIEVITNPSSRYEAEGSAGIINIVLKKDRRGGFNGSFDFVTGDPYKLGIGVNSNYRSGPLNFFLNYSIRDNTSFGKSYTFQENYFDDQTRASFINRDFESSGISHTFRAGLGYTLAENTVLTFSGLYRSGNDSNDNITSYADYFLPAGTKRIDRTTLTGADLILRPQLETAEESNSEFSINLDKQMGKGHTLRAGLNYRSQNEIESSNLQEYFANANQDPLSDPYLFQRTINDEGENSLVFNLDYVRPVGEKGSMEFGVRSSIRSINNDYLVEEQNDEDIFQSLPQFSNDFLYDEGVHAAYYQYGNEMGKISYQVGLRGEYSNVVTELKGTNKVNDRDYANLFPSAFINYAFSETDGMQVSYSRRIRRPRFHYLNPFFGFSDPRNFYGGNPDLDPEFSNNFELGYLKYWDKASLTSSIYYRHTYDVIERIQQKDITDESVLIRRPENIGTEDNFGFEFVGNLRPTKWWRLDGNLNLYRSITEGQLGDIVLNADTYSWSSRASSRFTFWNDSDVQIRYNYRAGQQTTQGNRNGAGTTDIAFSKDFLKKNLTLTLNIRDLFNSRRYESETITDDFYSDGFYQRRLRDISINLNYRLNMKKDKRNNRENERGGDDFDGGEF